MLVPAVRRGRLSKRPQSLEVERFGEPFAQRARYVRHGLRSGRQVRIHVLPHLAGAVVRLAPLVKQRGQLREGQVVDQATRHALPRQSSIARWTAGRSSKTQSGWCGLAARISRVVTPVSTSPVGMPARWPPRISVSIRSPRTSVASRRRLQDLEGLEEEQRLGLADQQRTTARGRLERGDQGAGAGDQPAFAGEGRVLVGGDEHGPGLDRQRGFRKFLPGDVTIKAGDDGLSACGVLHQAEAGLAKRRRQAFLADGEHGGAGGQLVPEEGGGRIGRGQSLFLPQIEAEGFQPAGDLREGSRGVVGGQHEGDPSPPQCAEELGYARQRSLPTPQHAIDVADHGADRMQVDHPCS